MGFYINPQGGETKEQFLNREATRVANLREEYPGYASIPSDKALVCLVDNGPFTDAGICVDQREYDAFTESRDYRPRKYYIIDRVKLLDFVDAGEFA